MSKKFDKTRIGFALLGVFLLAGCTAGETSSPEAFSGGKLVVTEYSDFECPYCARVQPTLEEIKQTYKDRVEVVFKHFPLRSIHPYAQKAAEASECARDQGMFWEYHDKLFENQARLNVPYLKRYAEDLGLDGQLFNDCLDSGEKASVVQSDLNEGNARGVRGTPAFFIGGEKISGAQPFSVFKEVIDAELKRVGEEDAEQGGVEDLTQGEIGPSGKDPNVTLLVVSDENCVVCEPEKVVDLFKSEYFPTLKEEYIDASTLEGKQVINLYGITMLPAYVFGSNLDKTAGYSNVSGAFYSKNGSYLAYPAAVGSAYHISAPNTTGRVLKGSENASVTIVEYSDFECPYCGKFYKETLSLIESEYVDKGLVKFVYKDFPLDSIHPYARKAAEAAKCAAEQGVFWEYHDVLFSTGELDTGSLKQHAESLGLNTTSFDECLDSGRYAKQVEEDRLEGLEFGVSGTPAFMVNNILVSGAQPFSVFEEIIDAEIEKE